MSDETFVDEHGIERYVTSKVPVRNLKQAVVSAQWELDTFDQCSAKSCRLLIEKVKELEQKIKELETGL